MPYILGDLENKIFITTDKARRQTITSNIAIASKFQTYEKALNHLSGLPKILKKKKLSVLPFTEKEEECLYEQIVEECEKESEHRGVSIDLNIPVSEDLTKIIESVKIISDCSIHLTEQRLKNLQTQLINLERELTDVYHASEFFELNVVQGYKIYKQIHDIRLKRREIKNEITIISIINSSGIIPSSNECSSRISGLESRSYIPRINKELFN